MAFKTLNPDRIESIEILDVEIFGTAAGYDEEGRPAYTIIFMPRGADPDLISDQDLFQVLIGSSGLSHLLTGLNSLSLTVGRDSQN